MNTQTNATPAVHCLGITKHFRTAGDDVTALGGVDLDVDRGEFLMLVGPSGCGKTTLISIIASVLAFDNGKCTVLGADYSAMKPSEKIAFRARHIGFIFQQYNLLPSLTVAQNVAVPLIINGMERTQAIRKAEAILQEVGLGDRTHHQPALLSGGQQQRVAIARALVHEPEILLCDEPTSALDHETGIRILELMRAMNQKRGTTCIIVTHDSRIFSYASRIAHMDDGKIDRIYHQQQS